MSILLPEMTGLKKRKQDDALLRNSQADDMDVQFKKVQQIKHRQRQGNDER